MTDSDDELKEFVESEEKMQEKVDQLVRLVKNAKHLVVYTGAGISTAAKISDFRGPDGVWTRRDAGLPPKRGIPMESATPTLAHMAIKTLIDKGKCAYLVSQNVDGLHRRSGVPGNKISELHGNCFKETCPKCEKEFLRDYDVCRHREPVVGTHVFKDYHATGRNCTACKTGLRDSIIHFGENLPVDALQLGYSHSRKADVAFVIGTSLKVTPAADLPKIAKKESGASLVIVNLQRTPKDRLADVRIWGKCDDVMKRVMKGLEMEIEPFVSPSEENGYQKKKK